MKSELQLTCACCQRNPNACMVTPLKPDLVVTINPYIRRQEGHAAEQNVSILATLSKKQHGKLMICLLVDLH